MNSISKLLQKMGMRVYCVIDNRTSYNLYFFGKCMACSIKVYGALYILKNTEHFTE